MDPGELLFLLGFLVVLPLAILRMVFKHNERKMKMRESGGQSNSLTVSELEDMIEEAVQRGIEPIDRRMSGLENRVDGLLPQASEKLPLKAGYDQAEAPEEEAPAKTVGRIQRLT